MLARSRLGLPLEDDHALEPAPRLGGRTTLCRPSAPERSSATPSPEGVGTYFANDRKREHSGQGQMVRIAELPEPYVHFRVARTRQPTLRADFSRLIEYLHGGRR